LWRYGGGLGGRSIGELPSFSMRPACRCREVPGFSRARRCLDLKRLAAGDAWRLPDGEDDVAAVSGDVVTFADAAPCAFAVTSGADRVGVCPGRPIIAHWLASARRISSLLPRRLDSPHPCRFSSHQPISTPTTLAPVMPSTSFRSFSSWYEPRVSTSFFTHVAMMLRQRCSVWVGQISFSTRHAARTLADGATE
jgi:hypothetical protein